MKYLILITSLFISFTLATPPACFLSCINELSRDCGGHSNMTCLCNIQDEVTGCLVDICPYGSFESARDHYYGTCLEHKKPTFGRYPPYYPIPVSSTSSLSPKPTSIPDKHDKHDQHDQHDKPEDKDCDSESSDESDSEYDICKWEEEETIDKNGNIIITRRPLEVPQKYLDSPHAPKKRILIVKKPKDKLKKEKVSMKSTDYVDHIKDKIKSNDQLKLIKQLKDGTVPKVKKPFGST